MHYSYHNYGPEYYPGPSYPIYPEEEYFPQPIHVKSSFCYPFSNYFFDIFKDQPPLSTILHGGSGGTVLFSSIENARNTVNTAQSQLARDLQMEYAPQQPITSLMVRLL